MPPIRLTQRRVDVLRPRRKVRDIRDAELKGYGVRVMPSGARRYFIHSQHRGKRVWKIIGDAAAVAEPEARARARARSMLAALRDGREPDAADPGGTFFETVAEEVFERYGRRWKPRTLDVNRNYLRRQILPFFAGRPIGEITREDVRAWFRGLHATPAAANRSTPILSVIMQQAEAWGYRPENSNPCTGIRRYRQGRSERFLTPEEYRRLAAVLGRHEARRPLHAAALHLLLLTGCRKSEILTLQWRSYREGRLYLTDSKTGPHTVWLCEAARDVLDSLPRSSGWVFPVAGRRTPWLWLDYFWARREGGSRAAGRPPARHQAFIRQHGAALRRERALRRPPARSREGGDHPEIRPSVRCHGPRSVRDPVSRLFGEAGMKGRRVRLVERPSPDLRGGCAAMRIPTATEGESRMAELLDRDHVLPAC